MNNDWPDYYILVGRLPVAVDLMTWARWVEDFKKRQIGDDEIGKVRVSTVFLGVNHNFFGRGDPVLFETMIFGGPLDGEEWRYASYDEAERGHGEAVAKVRIAAARIKAIADNANAESE
jgi:hypothetical protein